MPSRATRGKTQTSVSRVSHAGRTQINPICAFATDLQLTVKAAPNGGSVRVLFDHLSHSACC